MTINYALIGCGRIAINHINAAIKNGINIVAMCDIQEEKINTLLERAKYEGEVKKYTNYKEMLDDNPCINLVAIATESGVHAEIALYCIRRKINVIIEKPIAMSIEDANEIVKEGKTNRVKVTVCHQNRFNMAVQQARKATEKGRFGKLSHGSVNVRWNRNKGYYDQADWRGKWSSDGGCLMNQCIHGIDLLRWMMNDKVTEVYGVTRRRFHDYLECEDVGEAILKFQNGSLGTIEGTVNVFPKNLEETLYIFGEKGTVKIGGTSTNNIDIWNFETEDNADEINKDLKEETINVYGNGHQALYKDMIDSIRDNRDPYITAEDGRNAVEIVLAIYKSSFENRPVKLPLTSCSSTDFTGGFDK